MIKHISPSSYSLWIQDEEAYFMRYKCKLPREPQTKPMAVGSSFDAYIKARLYKDIFGDSGKFDSIFEGNVQPQNRTWGREHGRRVFGHYVTSRRYSKLRKLLEGAEDIELSGRITRIVEGIPLNGLPDLSFRLGGNLKVLDWKVNGYLSQASPKAGFINCVRLSPGGHEESMVVEQLGMHKSVTPSLVDGIMTGLPLERSWNNQLAIYFWLLGSSVGAKGLYGLIDQFAYKRNLPGENYPRVVEHVGLIVNQRELMDNIIRMWEIVNSNHFFRSVSEDESQAREKMLRLRVESQVGADKDDKFWDLIK